MAVTDTVDGLALTDSSQITPESPALLSCAIGFDPRTLPARARRKAILAEHAGVVVEKLPPEEREARRQAARKQGSIGIGLVVGGGALLVAAPWVGLASVGWIFYLPTIAGAFLGYRAADVLFFDPRTA